MDLTGIGGIFVNLYKEIRKDQMLDRWWRFGVSCALTTVIVFPFIAGSAYLAGMGGWKAIASGAVTTSLCLFGVYRASPLAQGLMVEVPKELIEQIQEHPDQVLVAGKDATKQ